MEPNKPKKVQVQTISLPQIVNHKLAYLVRSNPNLFGLPISIQKMRQLSYFTIE